MLDLPSYLKPKMEINKFMHTQDTFLQQRYGTVPPKCQRKDKQNHKVNTNTHTELHLGGTGAEHFVRLRERGGGSV